MASIADDLIGELDPFRRRGGGGKGLAIGGRKSFAIPCRCGALKLTIRNQPLGPQGYQSRINAILRREMLEQRQSKQG